MEFVDDSEESELKSISREQRRPFATSLFPGDCIVVYCGGEMEWDGDDRFFGSRNTIPATKTTTRCCSAHPLHSLTLELEKMTKFSVAWSS